MSTLRSLLRSVVGDGRLLTIQPGGNHGDGLIYRGFDRVVSDLACDRVPLKPGHDRVDTPPDVQPANMIRNLEWLRSQKQYLQHRLARRPDAVYVHGGGNFNDIWGVGVKCYRTAGRYFDCPIVIGPQSCRFEDADPGRIFDAVDNETHLFCREEYSRELMEDVAGDHAHVSVHLADDTALALTTDALPVTERRADYALVAMRADAESASPLLQEGIDPPIKVSDVSTAADSFEDFVRATARAECIHTDRLHVAILATLLDKPVTWYEVGYHKSRGVYERSLADRENIRFVYRDSDQPALTT